MKKIQLMGIGNALVDVEFRVEDHELDSFGVQKGTMTLTDPVRQMEMIRDLGERESHRSSGGSVANSVIAFAQFGGKGAFCSLLGQDDLGSFYASEFKDLGIQLQADLVGGETTGTCLVLITPDSERTLNTTLAVNTNFNRAHVNEDVIQHSEWLYIEGYKLTDDSGAEAMDMAAFYAKKHDTNIAVSCSDKFIVDVFGDRLSTVLKHTDLVFCNEMEALALSDEENIDDAMRSLRSRFKNVVITLGDKGSYVKWDGREAEVPAYTVKPIDTTGAGDMFAAGFLYGVLHRYHPERAGRLAAYAAAQVVSQYGARLKASHIEVRDSVLSAAETHS